jgi:sulfide:quinone oxidoreductase
MGVRIVILGGGTAGLVAANTLRRLPAEHKITVVERHSTFHMGATKPWVMLGEKTAREVSAPLDRLKKRGIDLVRANVKKIDVASRSVETDQGTFQADYLIIALGADYAMDSVPGLTEAAQTFSTLEGAERLRPVWKDFRGGDVVVLITRAPFKCPPAPYEGAMLMAHDLKKRGIAGKVHVYTLEGAPMATAGPEIGAYIRKSLEERGVQFHPMKRTKLVDGARKAIVFEDGSEAKYDLLVAVPPHVAPNCVRDSGLTNPAGWIPVDLKTLRLTAPGVERVFAIGDVTSVPLPGRFKPETPLVLPKAGVFASGQAYAVATQIFSEVLKTERPLEYAGKGFCYIEMGDRHAARGDGSFFEMPNPTMRRTEPSMNLFDEKREWVAKFMRDNLG